MVDSRLKLILKDSVRRFLSRRVRPHRILAGPLRGRRIVTSWHDYPAAILGRTEGALITWLQRNVGLGDTWLDVGAHYGYTAIAMAEMAGENGRVFAFEPVLTTVGSLCLTRDINRLHQLAIVPFALDDSTSMRTLTVPTRRGMATPSEDTRVRDTIYLAALEHIWDMLARGQRQIHGVKMDVQGMEFQALSGMSRILSEQRPKLVIEFHSGVARQPILDLLARVGYRLPATPVDRLISETGPIYADDRSYAFEPKSD